MLKDLGIAVVDILAYDKFHKDFCRRYSSISCNTCGAKVGVDCSVRCKSYMAFGKFKCTC